MENDNWKTNPLGENPMGEGFVADNSFGNVGTNGNGSDESGGPEKKVCPQCGMELPENETFCMACGMTVIPVLKKDYDKAVAAGQDPVAYGRAFSADDSNGSGAGAHAYGGGNSYDGQSRSASSYSYSKKENEPSVPYMTFWALVAFAAIAVLVFFVHKLNVEKNAEKTTILYRTIVESDNTVDDTVIFTSNGDKVSKIKYQTALHVNGWEQNRIDQVINVLNQEYAPYETSTSMHYSIKQENSKLVVTIEYEYLNVMENLQKMLDDGLLEKSGFDNSEITIKDYISLDKSTSNLRKEGYKLKREADK